MKTKLLVLLLIVAIFTTVLCSCEALEFVNHMLNIFGPDDDSDTNIDLDINIGGTTAHVHTEVVIPAVESTCTATGLSEGKKCKDCGEIIVPQVEVSLKAHTYDNSVDKYCNVCEHERDIDCSHEGTTEFLPAKESTCTEAGLTQGVRCTLCGEIVVAQQSLPLKDHVSSDWIVDYEATTENDGLRHIECTICGTVTKQETIPMIIPSSEGLEYKLNSDYVTYSVSSIGTCTSEAIFISDTYDGKPVTGIAENAFENCDFITSVTLPESIKSIGNWAFYNCKNLKSRNLSDSLTDMGHSAFMGCASLESIVIPESLTTVKFNTFYGCGSLVNVTLGNNIEIIEGGAFRSCASLVNITIPESVTKIDYSEFESCRSLITITIPDSVVSIGEDTFRDCKSLKSAVLGESITSISKGAFWGCKVLESVTMSDNVNTIGKSAFFECFALKDISLSKNLTTICSGAFHNCGSLIKIVIPLSVTTIENYAFANNMEITFYCEAPVQPEGWSASWNGSNRPVVWGYTGN